MYCLFSLHSFPTLSWGYIYCGYSQASGLRASLLNLQNKPLILPPSFLRFLITTINRNSFLATHYSDQNQFHSTFMHTTIHTSTCDRTKKVLGTEMYMYKRKNSTINLCTLVHTLASRYMESIRGNS